VLSSDQYGAAGRVLFRAQRHQARHDRRGDGRAREAAEQFARDAQSRLGGIRRANQGVFVILPRDQAPGLSEESQLFKTVRVVTSVDYYLKD
jgi:hypothetical protein